MNDVIAALVRRRNPGRFLTAQFVPAPCRDAPLRLYAFNHGLARARSIAHKPPPQIRLQWWREMVDGAQVAGQSRTIGFARPLPPRNRVFGTDAAVARPTQPGHRPGPPIRSAAHLPARRFASVPAMLTDHAIADRRSALRSGAGAGFDLVGLFRHIMRVLGVA
ncbi:squalene/phytoene synthase family protein [Rhodopila globiformis]|nr:squalene/phytoene synthase family protein [Rhodopila globiformis]